MVPIASLFMLYPQKGIAKERKVKDEARNGQDAGSTFVLPVNQPRMSKAMNGNQTQLNS